MSVQQQLVEQRRKYAAASLNLLTTAKRLERDRAVFERAKKAQKSSNESLAKAKESLNRQNEVTADHICHIFRDALETRTVIARGARAPNGSGPARRYYRESCADPGSTSLKRLRCAKLCCRAYDQHISPKGTRPGDRDHCDGVECKVSRRSRGASGAALKRAAAEAAEGSRPRPAAGSGSRPGSGARPAAGSGSGSRPGSKARPAAAKSADRSSPAKRPAAAKSAARSAPPKRPATAKSADRSSPAKRPATAKTAAKPAAARRSAAAPRSGPSADNKGRSPARSADAKPARSRSRSRG